MMASRKALIMSIRQWNETKLRPDEHKVIHNGRKFLIMSVYMWVLNQL